MDIGYVPAFDGDDTQYFIMITDYHWYNNDNGVQVKEWLKENKIQFDEQGMFLAFECEKDVVMFKLRWF